MTELQRLNAFSSDSGNPRLTVDDVDYSMVGICKKIRKLAKLDRIALDTTEHRSGLNKHLLSYIEFCGLSPLDFIKEYLAHLQPYMLQRRKDQEARDSFICVIDNMYRVSIYIKIDSKQFEELIVSFHEDNKRGVAKANTLLQNRPPFVPVLADSVAGVLPEDKYVIKVFIQRGMKVLPIELPAIRHDDVFVVEARTIETAFVSYCNEYIRDLYTSDLNLDFDKIEVFSFLQQISFTSYGRDTFSSISLLIDNLCIQPDFISRCAADCALVTFVENLKLTADEKEELISLLYEKFSVTSIKGIDVVLSRVQNALESTKDY